MREFNPIEWAIQPLKNYAVFTGRAPRAEYWWYSLAVILISLVGTFIDRRFLGSVFGNFGPLGLIQALALLVPGIALSIRRLHDIDRSGWWLLLNSWVYASLLGGSAHGTLKSAVENLPTGVGFLLVLSFLAAVGTFFVFMILPGTEGPNRYGPDPYGPSDLEEVFA